MSQTIKEWLPLFMPLISLFLGLTLTLILTAIKQAKKNKFTRSKLEFLEKENNDLKLDFKLYKEKSEAWAFDMKVDLKKAQDLAALKDKKIEMLEKNSNVEYNKELEQKLTEYMKSTDTLSNEVLRYKEIIAEANTAIKKLQFENSQLKEKIALLDKELKEQENWDEQIKKFESLLNNLGSKKKLEDPKPVSEGTQSIISSSTEDLDKQIQEIKEATLASSDSEQLAKEQKEGGVRATLY